MRVLVCCSRRYCGPEHQRAHWPTHRDTCVAPTPQQDAEREAMEKRAAQLAMLGPNGRTKLVMPVRVKDESNGGGAGAGGADSDIEEGVEEVDSLVSLRCPLSIERYAIPARGKHCAHLTCFDLRTFLEFSQQSGVWQCQSTGPNTSACVQRGRHASGCLRACTFLRPSAPVVCRCAHSQL